MKKWILFVILGVAALAGGDVVTPGGSSGGSGGGFVPIQSVGLVLAAQVSQANLVSDGAGGGTVRVTALPLSVPATSEYVAMCLGAGDCGSGWVELADWQTIYVTYTCADIGFQGYTYCSNNDNTSAADACIHDNFVNIEDNESVCPA